MPLRRASLRCACAALLAATAGCTAASSSQTVTGKTLYIYVSAPTSAGGDVQQQDVLYAEKLAFNQLQGNVTAFKLSLQPVAGVKLSDNARAAISNTGTIAYVGEVAPGSSADTIGITNAQDVLQISPTDTAAELTQTTPAIRGAPNRYYESLSQYGRTFARVVPTTAVEAQAVVRGMHALGIKRLYVTGDQSEYGKTLAQAVTAAASSSITTEPSAAQSQAICYAGRSPGAAAQLANGNPKLKFFAPSALAGQSFVSLLSPAAQPNALVSTPGFLPTALNAQAKKFAADFRKTYGHAPATEAVFGYAAMSALINVLAESGTSANNRKTVVQKFLGLRDAPSVLGPLSMNGNGDTNISAFVLSRVKAGKLVPFKAA